MIRRRAVLGAALGAGALWQLPRVQAQGQAPAQRAGSWSTTIAQARGQTVNFHAWGGSEPINAYLTWAAGELKRSSDITLRHVRVADAAEFVQRIRAEAAAGRRGRGTVDLVWINGENFRTLKEAGLLFGPWAEALPNWQWVDTRKPVRTDFSIPVEGLQAPWGLAQLTLITDRRRVPQAPRDLAGLLAWARANPGRFSYPRPPQFHGTSFVKQVLLDTAPDQAALGRPVQTGTFTTVTAPLWAFLDALHPHCWRQGKAFPAAQADQHRLFADQELAWSISFNPNEVPMLIAQGQVPATSYSTGFATGMLANIHFLAIPVVAQAPAAAQVVADFLLSPLAQARKADVQVWGDPTVLDVARLPVAQQAAFGERHPAALPADVPARAEPHASWVEALEAEWLRRYGVA